MLFSSVTVKDAIFQNRVVMPPMCMYKADNDGVVTDWHVIHYATRAVGQAGLVIVEATGVEPRGRISNRDLGIWDDAHIAGLRRIVHSIHSQGGKVGIQLAHAGRKSEAVDSIPVAPSAIPFNEHYRTPLVLENKEIQGIVGSFADAARRAVAAGFDMIEIHAAHGYLLNEFLSPLTNARTDEYGGSPKNRARILREVLSAVKQAVTSSMLVSLRVSADEYHVGGNTPEAVADLVNVVKDEGVDVVHVSSGGVVDVAPRAYPGYQIPFALTIKEKTGLPVIGGGLITQPIQAEQIIKAGVDFIFLGRELLRNPYWTLQAAYALQQDMVWPEPYVRGKWL